MIYLASPYSHRDPIIRQRRFDLAVDYVSIVMLRPQAIYSPIVHCHPVALKHKLPKGWDFWKLHDLAILRHADELQILCIPGWQDSVGVRNEINFAMSAGIRIAYIEPDIES